MNEGWKCPVCEKGNAPHADKCGHCAQGVTFPQPNLPMQPFGPPPLPYTAPYWWERRTSDPYPYEVTWKTTDNTDARVG